MMKSNPELEYLERCERRYRYLRDHAQYNPGPLCLTGENSRGHIPVILSEEELDDAVDSAIEKLGKEFDAF